MQRVPGTYVLESAEGYSGDADGGDDENGTGGGGGGPTGVHARATLYVFAGDALRVVTSRGTDASNLPADTGEGFTFTSAAGAIDPVRICPQAGATSTIGYSASADSLALYPDATHRVLSVRR